jgi:hypothetical protein
MPQRLKQQQWFYRQFVFQKLKRFLPKGEKEAIAVMVILVCIQMERG